MIILGLDHATGNKGGQYAARNVKRKETKRADERNVRLASSKLASSASGSSHDAAWAAAAGRGRFPQTAADQLLRHHGRKSHALRVVHVVEDERVFQHLPRCGATGGVLVQQCCHEVDGSRRNGELPCLYECREGVAGTGTHIVHESGERCRARRSHTHTHTALHPHSLPSRAYRFKHVQWVL